MHTHDELKLQQKKNITMLNDFFLSTNQRT